MAMRPLPMMQPQQPTPEIAAPPESPFKDFRWFDTSPSVDKTDPNNPIFMPGRRGGLAALGQALSGIAAPFVGNMDFALEQAKLQQQREEADMEFQKYLIGNKTRMDYYGNGVPVLTYDPTTGGLMPLTLPGGGNVPRGTKVVTNPNAPTAEMVNQSKAADQARALVEDLRTQAYSLKGGYFGIKENVKAFVNRGKGESSDYVMYNDSLPSTSVALYRAITGDTRLSDADAQARAYPLLWRPSQDPDVREDKFKFIDRMLDAREKILKSGKYGDSVLPWSVVMKEARKGGSAAPKSQTFNIGGKMYDIPADKVEAFKKAKGLK